MRCSTCVWAFVSLSWPLVVGAVEEKAVRPIDKAESILAIYPEDWGRGSPDRVPALILAIWPDGHTIWSKDRLRGGAPYYAGQVDPESVRALLSRFEQDGLFADKQLNEPKFGPDSHFTTMLVKSGKQQVKMQSWHEPFEAGGKSVAGSHGVFGLDGKRRLDVLRREPADYLFYRFVWSETRGRLVDLIPADGKPVVGKPVTKDGELFWQELPGKAVQVD